MKKQVGLLVCYWSEVDSGSIMFGHAKAQGVMKRDTQGIREISHSSQTDD